MRAKRASWAGESVPVRISGRASTVIRRYGAANSLPFAEALDELLKASAFFRGTGSKWEDVTPYKSHRRDKHTTENTTETASKPQDGTQAAGKPQDVQEVKPQEVKPPEVKPQEVTKAAKTSVKTTAREVASRGEATGKGGKA